MRTLPRRLTRRGEEVIWERIPVFRRELKNMAEQIVMETTQKTNSNTIAEFAERIRDSVLHAVDGITGVRDLGRVTLDIDADPRIHRKELVPVGLTGLVVEQVVVPGVEAADGTEDIECRP